MCTLKRSRVRRNQLATHLCALQSDPQRVMDARIAFLHTIHTAQQLLAAGGLTATRQALLEAQRECPVAHSHAVVSQRQLGRAGGRHALDGARMAKIHHTVALERHRGTCEGLGHIEIGQHPRVNAIGVPRLLGAVVLDQSHHLDAPIHTIPRPGSESARAALLAAGDERGVVLEAEGGTSLEYRIALGGGERHDGEHRGLLL
mmetsp:Transcript_4047/g.10372  ORF Transcript_4047/g.10372 Transcript_4047/m.10372 type:complete len:203 (+) Transcript_4047:5748-6356(+)